MADVSKINGYDVKDTTARQEIESLREEISNIEPPEINTDNLATKEDLNELREEMENITPVEKEKFFIDSREEDPSFEGVDIFSINEGTVQKPEGGNAAYYRIPALTVSAKNTLIAFTDVRYDSAGDQDGRISIFCRRSEDKGVSWGPAIEVCKYPTNGDGTATSNRARSMDSTVIASKSGKLFCLNGAWKSNPNNWSQYTSTPDPDWLLKLSVSEDDGKSWVTYNLNELPDMCKGLPDDMVSMLGGVGQGIQMYDGTLVFPVQLTRRPNGVRTICATVLYSKDDGVTWQMAEGYAPAIDGEDNVVEISPGHLLMNARQQNARQTFITKDMGKTWEKYEPMYGLIGNGDKGCQGSSSKITIDDREIFLHSSPIATDNSYARNKITLYASYDWESYDLIRTYYPPNGNAAGAGYSCLAPAVIDDQLCLFAVYERQGNIAFRNLGMDLKEIANRADNHFTMADRKFEVNKSSLLNLLDKFASSELVLFNMLDNYLNNMSNAERGLMESQIVKIMGADANGNIIDRGGIAWEMNGEILTSGSTFFFNGNRNNYIRTKQLRLDVNYTIDFDVYVKGTTTTNWNFLFSLDNGETPGCGLAINGTNTWNPAFDYDGAPTYTDEQETFIGRWIHVTVTKSASEGAKIYHDGVLRYEKPAATPSTRDYQNFTIGNNSRSAKEFYGKIANFKVYNKIASKDEIKYLYDNRKHVDEYTFELSKFASLVPEELSEKVLSNIAGYKVDEFNDKALYDNGSKNIVWNINGDVEYELDNNILVFNNQTQNYLRVDNFLDINFSVDFDIFIDSAPGTTWTQVFCIGNINETPKCALGINGTDTWDPCSDGTSGNAFTDPTGNIVGEWIHATLVKDSVSGLTFYKNGVKLFNSKEDKNVDGNLSVSSATYIAIGNNVNPVKSFNGKIANFRIYDKSLSAEEVQNIANSASEGVIRKGYSPNGASFMDQVDIDFNNEKIVITADLSTCTGSSQNFISIGQNIGSWSGNNIHFYYYPSDKRMLIQCMQGGSAQNIEVTGLGENIAVEFAKEGLTVNGNFYSSASNQAMVNVAALTSVQVGSTEGTGRSNASNYTIKKVQK